MLENFLKFLGLSDNDNTSDKPIENDEKEIKEVISEEKIEMINPVYKQDISIEIDYDTNEEIKTIKTITPISNKLATLNIKTEKTKIKGIR